LQRVKKVTVLINAVVSKIKVNAELKPVKRIEKI